MAKITSIKLRYTCLSVIISCILLGLLVIILLLLHRGQFTLDIENQSGFDIYRMIVLWPNGTCTTIRQKQLQGTSIRITHIPTTEGTAEIFFLISNNRKWFRINGGGYMCSNLKSSNKIIITKDCCACPGTLK
jgi:hypothetical protein